MVKEIGDNAMINQGLRLRWLRSAGYEMSEAEIEERWARELEMAMETGQGPLGDNPEQVRSAAAAPRPMMASVEAAVRRAQGADAPTEMVSRLPRSIAGGFRGLGDDLERRARDWRSAVRLLQQQGPQFEYCEAERERLYEQLGRVVTEVNDSGRALRAGLTATKNGDASGNLAATFTRNMAALEELESISEALATNLAAVRSTWEQYARTAIRAQKMRDELKADLIDR